jgi:hypothetical protein
MYGNLKDLNPSPVPDAADASIAASGRSARMKYSWNFHSKAENKLCGKP